MKVTRKFAFSTSYTCCHFVLPLFIETSSGPNFCIFDIQKTHTVYTRCTADHGQERNENSPLRFNLLSPFHRMCKIVLFFAAEKKKSKECHLICCTVGAFWMSQENDTAQANGATTMPTTIYELMAWHTVEHRTNSERFIWMTANKAEKPETEQKKQQSQKRLVTSTIWQHAPRTTGKKVSVFTRS